MAWTDPDGPPSARSAVALGRRLPQRIRPPRRPAARPTGSTPPSSWSAWPSWAIAVGPRAARAEPSDALHVPDPGRRRGASRRIPRRPSTPARVLGGLIVLAGVVLTRVAPTGPPSVEEARENIVTKPRWPSTRSPPRQRTGARASVPRQTKETRIAAAINLDGTGQVPTPRPATGLLDHMLEKLDAARPDRHHAAHAEGDLHTTTSSPPPLHDGRFIGIVLGECLSKALGTRAGIRRCGSAKIPMDETLTEVALDASNRPYLVWKVNFTKPKLGTMDTELFKEWFQAFAQLGGPHAARLEPVRREQPSSSRAAYKGLARVLRVACEVDPRQTTAVPSTKGAAGHASSMTVAIVDYGSGNLRSAAKAFERAARERHARARAGDRQPQRGRRRRPHRAAGRRRLLPTAAPACTACRAWSRSCSAR